eukprot:scaffold87830_cov36-Cyclotella_meneghiniana.AAC.3
MSRCITILMLIVSVKLRSPPKWPRSEAIPSHSDLLLTRNNAFDIMTRTHNNQPAEIQDSVGRLSES